MLVSLHDAAARDSALAGSKAAALATLLQAGCTVPDGVVLTTRAFDVLAAGGTGQGARRIAGGVALRDVLSPLADRYRDIPVAVRSSALAEDLTSATFAGQYETVLGAIGLAAIEEAVCRCWESLRNPAAMAYREHAGISMAQAMAVLIQPMVAPAAAGVALGADPLTGDRSRALVSAVRGLAAPLVSGHAVAEDWDVTATVATRRSSAGSHVLTEPQAMSIGATLRKAEQELGGPLEMEWALAGGLVLILQARPVTAIPAEVAWPTPQRGVWLRTIRLGEWLPEPVTPLFETWLLERVEERFRQRQREVGGIHTPPPLHVCVNGWYFHSPIGSGSQGVLFRGVISRPRLAMATIAGSRFPAVADRLFFRAQASRWRQDVLLPYQQAVTDAASRIGSATDQELAVLVDRLADLAGDFFWSLVLCGGAAWRFEIALARFHHRYLKGKVSQPYQSLLSGLADPAAPDHAAHSLDWYRQTIGELAPIRPCSAAASLRHQQTQADRLVAETDIRRILGARPRLRRRFSRRLALAQDYAIIRADHGFWFTLAWPVMRECVRLLGLKMASAGLLADAEDVFFITHEELTDYLKGGRPRQLSQRAGSRKAGWERDRRLSPPLTLGKAPLLLAKVLLSSPKAARGTTRNWSSVLNGIPASPGAAAGTARVVRDPTDTEAVQAGDVLVVTAAVPALAQVFDRIAALCVDGGSVAAHAALVAREYGIPAVVGLGNATTRLSDGMWVFVDGTAGVVNVQQQSA